jgi:hypothetical protein
VRLDQIRLVVDVDNGSQDARIQMAVEHMIDEGLPPSCISGFGSTPLAAAMRVPRPALSTIAVVIVAGIPSSPL